MSSAAVGGLCAPAAACTGRVSPAAAKQAWQRQLPNTPGSESCQPQLPAAPPPHLVPAYDPGVASVGLPARLAAGRGRARVPALAALAAVASGVEHEHAAAEVALRRVAARVGAHCLDVGVVVALLSAGEGWGAWSVRVWCVSCVLCVCLGAAAATWREELATGGVACACRPPPRRCGGPQPAPCNQPQLPCYARWHWAPRAPPQCAAHPPGTGAAGCAAARCAASASSAAAASSSPRRMVRTSGVDGSQQASGVVLIGLARWVLREAAAATRKRDRCP